MGIRERTFVVVEPSLRVHRKRRAVRVVVRHKDRVLLFADTDPGCPGSRWWTTPGGGIDPGETEREAAVRELLEEAGLELEQDALIGPIARRFVVHGYSDQVLEQSETFFAVDVEMFEVDTSGFTEDEKVTMGETRWYTMDELDGIEVWPHNLPELFASDGSTVIEMGTMEESTVPVQ